LQNLKWNSLNSVLLYKFESLDFMIFRLSSALVVWSSVPKLNYLLSFFFFSAFIFNNLTSECSVITACGRYRLPGGCSHR
jgi:hypothetical protein